jgi:hypothetical protein
MDAKAQKTDIINDGIIIPETEAMTYSMAG